MENHKMKAEKQKCPSCGGTGVLEGKSSIGNRICVRCGGSGEVGEPDAVEKFAMEEIKRMKKKPSEADKPKNITADWESYEEGYEQAERDFNTRIVSRIRELEAEKFPCPSFSYEIAKDAKLEVLRGLLEKKEEKK